MTDVTAPYPAAVAARLPGQLEQVAGVRATHPSWAGPVDLDVIRLQLTGDEQRAPRWHLTVDCHVPEAVDLLDPRTGVRLQLWAGYVVDGVEIAPQLFDLGLRSRNVKRTGTDAVLELEADSDEALVIDGSPIAPSSLAADTKVNQVKGLLTYALNPLVPAFDLAPDLPTDAGAVIDGITDRWATADDLADSIGLDVFDNGSRRFQLARRPTIAGQSAAVLRTGNGGTLTDTDSTLTRDGWFNRAVLTYRWRDGAGVDHQVTGAASVTAGSMATAKVGQVTYTEDRSTPTTQAQATAAAVALVKRLVSRGRSRSVRGVAAWWLRPGHTVTVQLATGGQSRELVSSVTFDYPGCWMDVRTRVPDLSTVTGE